MAAVPAEEQKKSMLRSVKSQVMRSALSVDVEATSGRESTAATTSPGASRAALGGAVAAKGGSMAGRCTVAGLCRA